MSRQPPKASRKPILGACLTALLALVALLTSVSAEAAETAPCSGSSQAPRLLTPHQMQTAELCLINRVRRHYGLRSLAFNAELRKTAIAHSVSMVVHDYFAHEGPGGSVDSRVTRSGYLGRAGSFTIGENIGGGGGRQWGSPMAVFQAWMHSPPHRANILDPRFREAGIGVARGYPAGRSTGAATYTADFGTRGD